MNICYLNEVSWKLKGISDLFGCCLLYDVGFYCLQNIGYLTRYHVGLAYITYICTLKFSNLFNVLGLLKTQGQFDLV